jgi:hypothetical protein
VFAASATPLAILDAIRARRTVVYGINGQVYGDPALIDLASAEGRLLGATNPRADGALDWISRWAGVAGLLGVALKFNTKDRKSTK